MEEDRSAAIEAAIVRIMKARRTLTHSELLAEVLAQLFFSSNSNAKVSSLIEREFLARDAENPNTYDYLA